jgi:GNAT superfamily N-acetyltransferase
VPATLIRTFAIVLRHVELLGFSIDKMVAQSSVPLTPAEHPQVIGLFQRTRHQHLHLDWRSLGQWLPHPDLRCRLINHNGAIESVLGVSIHADPKQPSTRTAWLRMAASDTAINAVPGLDVLWEDLKNDLEASGVQQIAVLATDRWIEPVVKRWGFKHTSAVISFRRPGGPIPPPPPSGSLQVYEIALTDLDIIAGIDAAAFKPLWQYNQETLELAFMQAATATALAEGERVLGYQLSTQHAGSGHLARLAVVPEAQGQGLGGILIREMLRFFESRGIHAITVNTQADNAPSQCLYRRWGFEPINHSAPVWTLML